MYGSGSVLSSVVGLHTDISVLHYELTDENICVCYTINTTLRGKVKLVFTFCAKALISCSASRSQYLLLSCFNPHSLDTFVFCLIESNVKVNILQPCPVE